MSALGFIEVKGQIGAIEAADVALKAADVTLVDIKKVTGGLVIVIIKGEVAAVQAAVESAKQKVRQVCRQVTTNVIPGPSDETLSMIKQIKKEKNIGPGIKKRRKQ